MKPHERRFPGSQEAVVALLPKCDFCEGRAQYDGKTDLGPWAYMCEEDYQKHGIGLGLGFGQKLVLQSELKQRRIVMEAKATVIDSTGKEKS